MTTVRRVALPTPTAPPVVANPWWQRGIDRGGRGAQEHGRERREEFVTEHGEETVLAPVRGFGGFLCLAQRLRGMHARSDVGEIAGHPEKPENPAQTGHDVLHADLIGPLYHDADLITKPLELGPVAARVPEGPGLGVELDEEQLEKYRQRT